MVRGKDPLIIAADFETITDPEDCRVWAYGWADIRFPDNVTIGNDIKAFLQTIARMGNSTVYFHNLKFDGTFIIDWLLEHGYEYSDEKFLERKEFSVLFSRLGKMYSIRVNWGKNKQTEFRDSAKKLPMTIAEIAEVFGLPMKKGELDYDTFRPVGHNLTKNEREYVHSDVSILAHALANQYENGAKKLTVGSDALDDFKQIHGRKNFRTTFPLLNHDTDAEIRRAYRGGYTYADKRFKGRLLECRGVVLDVNSLYPYVMREKSLPYGMPKPFEGAPPEGELSTFEVTFTAKIRKNHIPIIQIKKSSRFHESDYLDLIDEPVTLTVTNIDWALYNEHYHINVINYGKGFTYKHKRGIFDEYIDKWMEVKKNSTGGLRALAKLRLNSLYGKFCSAPDVTGKWPSLQDGAVKWTLGDEEMRDPVYTPMGVFITAYARDLTIRAAQANYDTFAYADTDSLHLLREDIPDTINVHPNELGAWKHEYDFVKAFYVRAKAYIEEEPNGNRTVRIAGLPVKVSEKLTFDDFYDGHVIHGKLVPRNVPGGVVLVDSPYELKM